MLLTESYNVAEKVTTSSAVITYAGEVISILTAVEFGKDTISLSSNSIHFSPIGVIRLAKRINRIDKAVNRFIISPHFLLIYQRLSINLSIRPFNPF
jgi:hypothetical protein